MADKVETLIIGAGQAGLSLSYYLTQASHDHLVVDKETIPGAAWRKRWDSFTLVTPNWTFRLPGMPYQGEFPDGYMPKLEILHTFEHYSEQYGLPLRLGAEVKCVERLSQPAGYRIDTTGGEIFAKNVVMATGLFQTPRVPAYARNLPTEILQLTSSDYRRPELLPSGAVLVVGSGQSGCQIADELLRAGRQVFFSTGSAGRAPRRYRGRDIIAWLEESGFFDRPASVLPNSRARFAANPHVSGYGGGRDLNLYEFANQGMRLLGHIQGADGLVVHFHPDLHDNLQRADQFEANLLKMIDEHIERRGIQAPAADLRIVLPRSPIQEVSRLDLASAGISTVIWAVGYSFDFGLVGMPVFDGDGYPIQVNGATEIPGLYFLGLPWLTRMKSGLLIGVAQDAALVAERIARKAVAQQFFTAADRHIRDQSGSQAI